MQHPAQRKGVKDFVLWFVFCTLTCVHVCVCVCVFSDCAGVWIFMISIVLVYMPSVLFTDTHKWAWIQAEPHTESRGEARLGQGLSVLLLWHTD